MIYTDQQLAEWWTGKSKLEKADLFERILNAVDEHDTFRGVINDWKRRAENNMSLSPKQLACLRKWER